MPKKYFYNLLFINKYLLQLHHNLLKTKKL